MDTKGKNILPIIGFTIIIAVVFSGFIVFRGNNTDRSFGANTSDTNNSVTRKIGSYSVDENGEVLTDDINKILVNTIGADINIYTHKMNKVKAHLYGEVNTLSEDAVPYLEIVEEGRTAAVRVKHPQKVKLVFSSNLKLDVFVPEDWINHMNISTVSGEISAQKLSGADISVKTTSGEMVIQDIKGKDVSMKTVSGEIEVGTINADNLYLKSTSGDFKIGNAVVSDTFEKSTVSGKCQVEEAECKEAELNTNSGDTTIKAITCDNIKAEGISGKMKIKMAKGSAELKTTSGNIVAEFEESFDLFKVNSVSGKVSLTIPENSQFSLDIRSVSGSINCNDFPINITTSKNNKLKGTVGNVQSTINIGTTSGDVIITKQ